jgi:hypothetical protein
VVDAISDRRVLATFADVKATTIGGDAKIHPPDLVADPAETLD